MSDHSPLDRAARRRKAGWLGAAALAAIVAGGGIGAGFVPAVPSANAELLSLEKPIQAVPSFADVVERVKPAVVSVRVKTRQVANVSDRGGERQQFGMPDLPDDHPLAEMFKRFQERGQQGRGGQGRGEEGRRGPQRFGMSQGSGFFISGDGYLVTNNHVVENADTVEIVMDDGRTLDAEVVGTDPKTDLALVKVKEGGDFPHVRLAQDKARIGDWVVAIGNPFGLGGTVTAGIVSAQARDIGAGPYDDFIQIDAPINRGNSGGPTFNMRGEVVGVNTAIYSPSGGNVGIAFAIPARVTESVIQQLKENGAVTRGFLGVQVQPLSKDIAESLGMAEPKGALVADTQPNTPAAKAGLKSGDVIVAVDGKPVKDARDLTRTISSLPPGSKTRIDYRRAGREASTTVELGTLPGEKTAQVERKSGGLPRLGLQLAPAGQDGSPETGVRVAGVDPDGPAAGKGIKAGDVILEVAGRAVSDASEIQAGIASAAKEGRKAVLLRVKTGDTTRFVAVALPPTG